MRVETIGDCVLHLGDCRELLPAVGDFDALVTDPPYGIGFQYEGYEDSQQNLEALISAAIAPAIIKAKRAVITPGVTNLWLYPPAQWVGSWTWDTTTARGFFGWSQWQPILLYGTDVWPGTGSKGGLLKSDRIHFSGGQAGIDYSDTGVHTCPKPIAFVVKLVGRFSLPDETILDPFMGSGTTGVACVHEGRKFIGIEREPSYFDIACRRIEEAYRQPRLFAPEPQRKPVQEVLL